MIREILRLVIQLSRERRKLIYERLSVEHGARFSHLALKLERLYSGNDRFVQEHAVERREHFVPLVVYCLRHRVQLQNIVFRDVAQVREAINNPEHLHRVFVKQFCECLREHLADRVLKLVDDPAGLSDSRVN